MRKEEEDEEEEDAINSSVWNAINQLFQEFRTVNMSKQCEICNRDFTRSDNLNRHMAQKHSNKELSKSDMMSTNPAQDDDHRMHLSDNSSSGEDVEDDDDDDDDTIVMHRPTVQKCLEKF